MIIYYTNMCVDLSFIVYLSAYPIRGVTLHMVIHAAGWRGRSRDETRRIIG